MPPRAEKTSARNKKRNQQQRHQRQERFFSNRSQHIQTVPPLHESSDDIGKMNIVCKHCHALKWSKEYHFNSATANCTFVTLQWKQLNVSQT